MTTPQIGPLPRINFVDKRLSDGPQTTDVLSTPANYDSPAAMDARLLALGYAAGDIRCMTQNDKVYAIRVADDSAGV